MRRNQMELALDATQAALADALQGLPYGWLRLETWAPGDGWMRYRLACCDAGTQGYYRELGPYMRRSAMLDTLHTLRAVAQEVSRMRREANARREEVTR